MAVDYDAPRVREDDIETESIEEVKAARATRAAHEQAVDAHDVVEVDTFELPGADLSTMTLDVEVQPQQADEFTCMTCFLVRHRSQLVDPARSLCVDCA
jgi:hypothetical protein